MAKFFLKRGDTEPIFETALKLPDGTFHDPTGRAVWLHILLADGTKLTRSMSIFDGPNGVVRYPWIPTDWDPGKLVTGAHSIEQESVLGNSRLTFPNDGTDRLIITGDIVDG